MFGCCKRSHIDKQADIDLTQAFTQERYEKYEKPAQEDSWFQDNTRPSNYFSAFFTLQCAKSMHYKIIAWIPSLTVFYFLTFPINDSLD